MTILSSNSKLYSFSIFHLSAQTEETKCSLLLTIETNILSGVEMINSKVFIPEENVVIFRNNIRMKKTLCIPPNNHKTKSGSSKASVNP